MSITGKDLNRDTQVSTPSKKGSTSSHPIGKGYDTVGNEYQRIDLMEESTLQNEEEKEKHLQNNSMYFNTSNSSQFDKIADNVNHTIKELCLIYNQIGYSSTETSIKKSEIFSVIQDTITNFTSNLQREKSNIENECEWLRQQIRIILAMIGNNSGDNLLSLANRGLIFNNREMYERGYKEEMYNAASAEIQRHTNFYASSPFNVSQIQIDTNIHDEEDDLLSGNDMVIPELSLLQLKSKLNSIFLDVLKRFVEVFKRFIEANLLRLEILDSIGNEVHSPAVNELWLSNLPNKEESESYREMIERFESIVRLLTAGGGSTTPMKETRGQGEVQVLGNGDEDTAYIISSPRKDNEKLQQQESELNKDLLNDLYFSTPSELMKSLREVNYKIVRVIRSLKITKITQDVFATLQLEIEFCDKELSSRMLAMHETIQRSFELIQMLQLNEDQLASVQRRYDDNKNRNHSQYSNNSNTLSNGSYLLDKETLQFIQSNPREFGLSDDHIQYLSGFADVLYKIKETKQKKWDHYFSSCLTLWEKLGENSAYVDEFLSMNSLLTDQALLNFKSELNRLYLKRSEFIETFILDSKAEIESLWTKLYYSQPQREQFKYYGYDPSTSSPSSIVSDKESILHEHEIELKNLKLELELKGGILDLYSQLNELLKDQNFLRESSKDSSRLLSKNSCKILLNEEKLRKKINKGLPTILKQLKQQVIEFNNAQLNMDKKPITIYGNDFFEKLILIESEQMQNKVSRNNVKPKVVTTRPSQPPNLKNKVSKAGASKLKSPTMAGRQLSSASTTSSSSSSGSSFARPVNNGNLKPISKLNSSLGIGINTSPTTSISPYKFSSSNALRPLNTPLMANHNNMSRAADTSSASSTSRFSPFKSSFSSRYSISPAKSIDGDNKENSFCTKYSLSPIKISEYINGAPAAPTAVKTRVASSTFNDNSTFDSSTIVADEYQTWRNERIKQLNSVD